MKRGLFDGLTTLAVLGIAAASLLAATVGTYVALVLSSPPFPPIDAQLWWWLEFVLTTMTYGWAIFAAFFVLSAWGLLSFRRSRRRAPPL